MQRQRKGNMWYWPHRTWLMRSFAIINGHNFDLIFSSSLSFSFFFFLFFALETQKLSFECKLFRYLDLSRNKYSGPRFGISTRLSIVILNILSRLSIYPTVFHLTCANRVSSCPIFNIVVGINLKRWKITFS